MACAVVHFKHPCLWLDPLFVTDFICLVCFSVTFLKMFVFLLQSPCLKAETSGPSALLLLVHFSFPLRFGPAGSSAWLLWLTDAVSGLSQARAAGVTFRADSPVLAGRQGPFGGELIEDGFYFPAVWSVFASSAPSSVVTTSGIFSAGPSPSLPTSPAATRALSSFSASLSTPAQGLSPVCFSRCTSVWGPGLFIVICGECAMPFTEWSCGLFSVHLITCFVLSCGNCAHRSLVDLAGISESFLAVCCALC